MEEHEWLAERFETKRPHLRRIAYRMLGSLTEAEDAVQETWLRLARADRSEIDNLEGWMTTVIARVCLDMLRSRKTRGEESLDTHVPDPVVSRERALDPEEEVILADSVGLALLVVLDTLTPAERLAFVLHDMFDLSFDEIAPIVGRSPVATRQLASRARRRVQGAPTTPDADLGRQREVVDAFLAASRGGNFDALLAVLDPDVVLRADAGAVPVGVSRVVRGARTVASQALLFSSQNALVVRPALVNGGAGIVSWLPNGEPFSVASFTVSAGRIVAIDILTDPARVKQIDLSDFSGPQGHAAARSTDRPS